MEFPVTVHWLRFDVIMCTIVAYLRKGVKSVVGVHVKFSFFVPQPESVTDLARVDSTIQLGYVPQAFLAGKMRYLVYGGDPIYGGQ